MPGVSFAFHGWTALEKSNPGVGFSRFMSGPASRFIGGPRVAEARKTKELNSGRPRRRGLKLVH